MALCKLIQHAPAPAHMGYAPAICFRPEPAFCVDKDTFQRRVTGTRYTLTEVVETMVQMLVQGFLRAKCGPDHDLAHLG